MDGCLDERIYGCMESKMSDGLDGGLEHGRIES